MAKHFNTDAFEAWLKAQGRKWHHMNTQEQIAAIKEFKGQAK